MVGLVSQAHRKYEGVLLRGTHIDAFHVDTDQSLMLFDRGVEEAEIPVDTSSWNTYIELAVEVGLEMREAFLQTLYTAHIDSGPLFSQRIPNNGQDRLHVMLRLDAICFGDFMPAGDRLKNVERGYVCTSLRKPFRKC